MNGVISLVYIAKILSESVTGDPEGRPATAAGVESARSILSRPGTQRGRIVSGWPGGVIVLE